MFAKFLIKREILFSGYSPKPTQPIGKPPNQDLGKLFVGGLPTGTTEPQFKEYFSQFGHVTEAVIKTNPRTGISRGFGFIKFATDEGVKNVLNNGQPHYLKGKQIDPKRARKDDITVPIHTYLPSNSSSSATALNNSLAMFQKLQSSILSNQTVLSRSGLESTLTSGLPDPHNNLSTVNKIYAGGLPEVATAQHVTEYFSQFGMVLHSDLKKATGHKYTKWFAFVTFKDYASVQKCLSFEEHIILRFGSQILRSLSRK